VARAEGSSDRFTERELHTIVGFPRTVNKFYGAHITRVETPRPRGRVTRSWENPVLREAVACASPSLAVRADRIAAGLAVPARQVLSADVALARYQLRAAGRPTPLGLFAGVAAARFGGLALVRFGKAHQAAARCDAAWLLSVIERCESCAPLAGRLTVAFSSLAVLHAGKWEVPSGPDRQVIRDSPAVRAVRDASQSPVEVSVLGDLLSSAFPGTGEKGTRMVSELVRLRFLITSLRPAMTTDALGHVTRDLRAAGADEIPEMAALLEQLEALHRELAAHNTAGPERQAAMRRARRAERPAQPAGRPARSHHRRPSLLPPHLVNPPPRGALAVVGAGEPAAYAGCVRC